MKKTYVISILIIVGLGVAFLLVNILSNNLLKKNIVQDASTPTTINQSQPVNNLPVQNTKSFIPPLNRAYERVTKKPFGIFINPQNSPIQPEKFRGYHTGTDFEIFPGEENADVPVKAVCSGKLEMKKYATGYGGVAVENCELDSELITVVYGHLKLASISKNAGDDLQAGDTLGILGSAYSKETDGERKHLHFGLHKGTAVSILGYVQNKTELANWIDPCLYVCRK